MSIALQMMDSANSTISYVAAGMGRNDGTGGSLSSLVNKLTGAALALSVGAYILHVITILMKEGGSGTTEAHKKLVHITTLYGAVAGLIIVAWPILQIFTRMAKGAVN